MKKQAQEWWKRAAQIVREAANQHDEFEKLVPQIANRDPHIAIPAFMALQQAGPGAIPALLMGLKHPYIRVRRGCVDIIDHGGYGGDARCIEALQPLLHDPVPHVRRAVWHTLFCERCPDTSKCEVTTPINLDRVALLIEIGINDSNPKLKQHLVSELGHYAADHRARRALEAIASEESDPVVRGVA